MISLADIGKWRERWNNTGVYCTAYRYSKKAVGGGDKTQPIWGHLYIDLDSKEPDLDAARNFERTRADALKAYIIFDALFGIRPEEVRCYFSGQKGIHLVIPAQVLGIRPHPDLNSIFQEVAKDLQKLTPFRTVDLAIYDRKRLFRLPGSAHQRSGLYKVPLTYDEVKTLAYEAVVELAKGPRNPSWGEPQYSTRAHRMWDDYLRTWDSRKAAREATMQSIIARGGKHLDYTPPCMRHIIMYGCRDGKRNNTAAALANHYKQRGLNMAEVLERMRRWNQNKVNPPLTDTEVETTVRSIYRGDYYYGCSSLEQLAPCDAKNCRMGSKRR